MKTKPVFISHAVANKDVADALVDLLQTGIGLKDSDIFCSSLEGLGIPSGKNFVEFIRQQIAEPRVVVLLLTVDYLNSHFCLCELGASWVLSHDTIPLLVEPLGYDDMKFVLTANQALKLNDKDGLNQMQDRIAKALPSFKANSIPKWEVKRNQFLEKLSTCKSLTKPVRKVTPEEHETLKQRYEEAVKELAASDDKLTKANQRIAEISALKDKKAVCDIFSASSDSKEKFEHLVDEAKDALRKVPPIVRKALFFDCLGEEMPWPGPESDYQLSDVEVAMRNDFLREGTAGVRPVDEDPKVANAASALNELSGLVHDMDANDPDFATWYVEKYGHRLKFESERFWDAHLK